jgi:hypothetical protein
MHEAQVEAAPVTAQAPKKLLDAPRLCERQATAGDRCRHLIERG